MPPDALLSAIFDAGRNVSKRWLRIDDLGRIFDGHGRLIATAQPGEARQIAAAMVAAYNESIARD